VITLIDAVFSPGKKKFNWNGRDYLGQKVSSGIYFCGLRAGNYHQVRKMILVN